MSVVAGLLTILSICLNVFHPTTLLPNCVRLVVIALYLANIRSETVPFRTATWLAFLCYLAWNLGKLFFPNQGNLPLLLAYFETAFPGFPMGSLFLMGRTSAVVQVTCLSLLLWYLLGQSVGHHALEISFELHSNLVLQTIALQSQSVLYFTMIQEEGRKYQQLLRKVLQVVEDKSVAKTFFISRMSHELRTPLQGLLSSASLLEQTPISEEQETYLSTINACGVLLLDIVVKILDITKIESGRFDSVRQRFSLIELVQNVLDSVATMADSKKVEVFTQFDPHPKGYDVEGDQAHFREILTNVRIASLSFFSLFPTPSSFFL